MAEDGHILGDGLTQAVKVDHALVEALFHALGIRARKAVVEEAFAVRQPGDGGVQPGPVDAFATKAA